MTSEPTDDGDPGFGRQFSDHMVTARYRAGSGWADPEVVPFAELSLSPAAMVFHYGQAIFEGLKAYRQPDGAVALFRPEENAARFNASAQRLAMPALPEGAFTAACAELVRVDRGWVPDTPGQSLYLRPLMVATEAALGVRPASEYLFAVIASPVGPYFASGLRPVRVWVSEDHVRAAPGGTGSAKCAGNYGASLAAKEQASSCACDEVLFLDAEEHRWIEELAGMNIILVAHGARGPTLVTPPVGDTILDGVTRKSVLELARRLGYETIERPVALEELSQPGSFLEAFACGTAAVIAPIGALHSSSGRWNIGDGHAGPVTIRLREALIALQEGRASDPFGWRYQLNEPAPAPAAKPFGNASR